MKKLYRLLALLAALLLLPAIGYAANRSPYLRPEHEAARLAGAGATSDVPSYGAGVYDLGNGVTLTVKETTPEDEAALDRARLNMIMDPLPLPSDTWLWVCDDDPVLATNLIVYNQSAKSAGSVHVKVTLGIDASTEQELYYYGIEPGTHGVLSFDPEPYSVELQGSSPYTYYKVRVTDLPWPL